jgi:hypothetical protein
MAMPLGVFFKGNGSPWYVFFSLMNQQGNKSMYSPRARNGKTGTLKTI